MNGDREENLSYPLIGSIQNSVGMGFIGNQAFTAVAHGLGLRVVHAESMFASAHGGFSGRTTHYADPTNFRRDVRFLVEQEPRVILVGFLPKAIYVDIVAQALRDFSGIVVLDPVIGDGKKGLYVSEETARAIVEMLLPIAQIITPNRFEADVLTGGVGDSGTEFAFLNALFDLGPKGIVVTSYERDAEKHRSRLLFTNGYNYARIAAPYYPAYPAHGAGDVFAASMACFVALGASPFAAALLATTLSSRAVANSSPYGGATVDPVAALEKWNPSGYQLDDQRTMGFCERSNVKSELMKATAIDAPRLKFAPPKHKILYG